MFCKHNWKLIGQSQYEGLSFGDTNIALMNEDQINLTMEMSLPKTSYLFQCSKCSKLKKETILGK